MTTFTTPDFPDLTDMVAQWRADAAAEILFGSGMLSVVLLLALVVAVGNVWQGRAGRDEVSFIDFVAGLLGSLLR